jgi:hypothetical protein
MLAALRLFRDAAKVLVPCSCTSTCSCLTTVPGTVLVDRLYLVVLVDRTILHHRSSGPGICVLHLYRPRQCRLQYGTGTTVFRYLMHPNQNLSEQLSESNFDSILS